MKLSLVLIIFRFNSSIAKETASFCSEILHRKKITSINIGSDFTQESIQRCLKKNSLLPELILVLGGDGTVLKTANELANLKIPILSFNVGGNLGFLTQDKKYLLDESFLNLIEENEFLIDQRTMLKCVHHKFNSEDIKNFTKSNYYALNDFYFKSEDNNISPTNQISIEIDKENVNEYKGDGLIISSATGSTAYSMAAGGPIVHPLTNAFIINPICPMSLASRPIVIPDTSRIKIKNNDKYKKGLQLWKDGTKCQKLNIKDFCEITKGSQPMLMISLNNSTSYYSSLSKKLEWRGNLH
tara:strand:- start:2613 stop:3509 length:897 start_codon:yes stop_codon:yes gene_type:complete